MSSPIRPPLTVKTIDGTTEGRPINTIRVTNGDLSISGTVATIDTSGGGGGGSGTVTSVGLTETGTALTITGSPVTTSGTINIAGAGTSSQVILGDLSLGTLTSGTVTSVGLTETGSALTITGTPVTGSGTINIAGAGTSSQVILGDLSLGTLTSGTVTGTGSANQVSYWTSSSAQAGSTGLTYDSTTGNLTVGGYVQVGTKITANGMIIAGDYVSTPKITTATGTDLTLDTVGGTDSGSIVIADGVDGQVSISANGTGAIKLGAANNPVTISNVYTLPTAVTTTNNHVLTAQTDGTTAWAASGGGGGDIGGSITDNQVAVGATTANDIEGSAGFTYDSSTRSLNIAAGTGTGTILSGSSDMVIRNSSGAAHSKITLGHDAANSNIKLDTDGTGLVEIHKEGSLAYSLPNVVTGTNGFVLTAQTDGSTAWAASGGGGSSYNQALNPSLLYQTAPSLLDNFSLSRTVGWGCVGLASTTDVTRSYDNMYLRPFIAPKSGDVDEIQVYVQTASASSDMLVGIYRDDAGLPVSKLGEATIDCSSTGSVTQTSISGTITLVAGRQYWYAWVRDNNAGSPQLRAESAASSTAATNLSTNSVSSSGNESTISYISPSGEENTLPTTPDSDLWYNGGTTGLAARIGVVIS